MIAGLTDRGKAREDQSSEPKARSDVIAGLTDRGKARDNIPPVEQRHGGALRRRG